MTIELAVFGPKSPIVASTLNNIANLYSTRGDYTKSLEYHARALGIWQAALGENSLKTADTYNNMATVYHKQGKFDEALAFHFKALKIKTALVDEEKYPSVALSYGNLAEVYQSLGKLDKALDLFGKALNIKLAAYGGEKNASVAETYSSMAVLHLDDSLQDFDKAMHCLSKALAIRQTVLGANHSLTAIAHENVATAFSLQREFEKALESYNNALAIWLKIQTPEPASQLSIAECYGNMGLMYDNLDRPDEALECHFKALDIKYAALPENHPSFDSTFCNIARVYYRQKQFTQAIEYFAKSLAIIVATYGEDSHDFSLVHGQVVLCRKAIATPEDAKFLKPALHEHKLVKLEPPEVDLSAFSCDVCHAQDVGDVTFHCFNCGFDVCGACFNK